MTAEDAASSTAQPDRGAAETSFERLPAQGRRSSLRFAAVLAAPIVVCAAVALLGSLLMTPIYAAEAELVFQTGESGDVSEQYRSTQVVLVTGRTVLDSVSRTLDVPFEDLAEPLTASFPMSSSVMRLRYTDPDPAQAVARLSAIVDRYTVVLGSVQSGDPVTHRLLVAPYGLDDPVSPKPLQSLVVGAVTGLALSFGLFAIMRRRQILR